MATTEDYSTSEESSEVSDNATSGEDLSSQKLIKKVKIPVNSSLSNIDQKDPDSLLKLSKKIPNLSSLRLKAKTLGIRGFSKMNKAKLQEAIGSIDNPDDKSTAFNPNDPKIIESTSKRLEEMSISQNVKSEKPEPTGRELQIVTQLKKQTNDQLRQMYMCRECSPRITVSKYNNSVKMTRPKNREEMINDLTSYCLLH